MFKTKMKHSQAGQTNYSTLMGKNQIKQKNSPQVYLIDH